MHDDELLRRFIACRDAGDAQGALCWWGELVAANFDRVRGMVDLRARRYGLSADEREEAVQLALVKLWRGMVRTFRGTSKGEWVNATKALVEFSCQQVQRDAARRSAREVGFGSPVGDPEGDDGATDDWRTNEISMERHRRDLERREAGDFVAWALPQLTNQRRRTVVERTLDGAPAEAIAAEIDVTMPNLYQLRRRGLDDLAKLRERYDR